MSKHPGSLDLPAGSPPSVPDSRRIPPPHPGHPTPDGGWWTPPEPAEQGDFNYEKLFHSLTLYLRSSWYIVAVTALVGALAGFSWASAQPKVFTARSTGFVTTSETDTVANGSFGDQYARSRVVSYKAVATSKVVAENVIERLQLSTTPSSLIGLITVTQPADTVLLEISAKGSSPENAQKLADAWVESLAQEVKEIESGAASTELTAAAPVIQVKPMGSAELPQSPTYPDIRKTTLLGATAGLAGGMAFGWIKYTLDKRIRSRQQIEHKTGLAVVGTLPLYPGIDTVNLMDGTGPSDRHRQALIESLRELRTNIRFASLDRPPRIIVVTSPRPAEGKSTLSINLARAFAANGLQVMLMDCDLRLPQISHRLGLPGGAGLTDVLSGEANLEDVAQQVDGSGLFVLGAGKTPPNPTEVLETGLFQNLIQELSKEFLLILDSPPVLPIIDAAILTRYSDGALLVAGAHKTTIDDVVNARSILERTNGKILGVVINRVDFSRSDARYYSYNTKKDYYGSSKDKSGQAGEAEPASAGTPPAGPRRPAHAVDSGSLPPAGPESTS